MVVYANLSASAQGLLFVLQSTILGTGAYLVLIEQVSGGIMIASSIVMGRALAPIEVALGTWKQLVAARQGIARLRGILQATAVPATPPVLLPRPQQHLSVHNLAVSAPGTQHLIVSDVSFALSAGMGLGLLGASASGKSALIKAVVGIWPAVHGVVRLDQAALDQWSSDDLGRYIGYLPQDVALLDGTVAENISRFDEGAASDAVLEAARIAGAHEMILGLPEGYASRIGEGGMSLSAGQRQRIGLARAVFGNPFLIVLDEPNANLDAEGENALARAILTMRSRQSIVIVASHRPSALASLNMALVMYQGSMIGFGPVQEVFARVALSNRAAALRAVPPAVGKSAAISRGVRS